MINIIIIGNTGNCDIANVLLKHKDINIVAGIVDYNIKDDGIKDQQNFLRTNNIKEINFSEVSNFNVNLAIILTYSKIIDIEYFKNTKLLNIHGAILPKWRGSSSNSWAIINGENEVGYTLHEANENFDDGNIYYIFKEKIDINEKYGDVVKRIRKQVYEKLPNVLIDIVNDKIIPQKQTNEPFVCTPKLKKEDGFIKNWNANSNYIYNIYRVMSYPYGTGVFFEFKNKKYEIIEMALSNMPDYIGIPGTIVNIINDELWIKTLDNIVIVKKILYNGVKINNFKTIFKIGQRL